MFRLLDNDVWIRELVGVAAKRGSLLSGHHPSWGRRKWARKATYGLRRTAGGLFPLLLEGRPKRITALCWNVNGLIVEPCRDSWYTTKRRAMWERLCP